MIRRVTAPGGPMLRSSFVAAAAAAVVAPMVLAQSAPPAQYSQPAGCEDAAVHISSNTLPRVGDRQWNDWVTLTGCGSRGAAVIAGALRSEGVRSETELTRLDHLANLLDGWFQPSLISAYESLLRTPDASYAARLRAMWLLSGLLAPSVEVAGPLQGFMSGRCESYERMTSLREAPATLPSNVYDQARDAMAFAADDRTAPEYVRTTARCWEGVVNGAQANADRGVSDDRNVVVEQQPSTTVVVERQPTTVVVERPVRVVYECDSRFVFYNEAGYDLAVRYGSYGSNGVLRVLHGGPFVWVAARFGPTRFWVGDQEVYYTDAIYRPCGGRSVVYAPFVRPWVGWHIGLGLFFGPRVVYAGPRPYRPVIVVPPRYVPPTRYEPRGDGRRDGRDDGDRGNRGRDDHEQRMGQNPGGGRRDEGPRIVPAGPAVATPGLPRPVSPAMPRVDAPPAQGPKGEHHERTAQPRSGSEGGKGKSEHGQVTPKGRERRPR